MKSFVALFLAFVAPLVAEEVTLKQPVVLKSDRTVMSVKAGTVGELIARDGTEITIKYKGLTGKVPVSKLEEAKSTATAKTAEPKKNDPPAAESKKTPPPNPPQTNYGKAVQKAKDNAAAHDKNVVKPADEILKDR